MVFLFTVYLYKHIKVMLHVFWILVNYRYSLLIDSDKRIFEKDTESPLCHTFFI